MSKKKYNNILVLATHLIGDCLLATCITRSLRHAYPNAQIDVMVTNTGGHLVFKDNTDINNIIEVPLKPKFSEYKEFVKKHWRRYDLVVNDRSSDRSAIYAFLAAKKRIGIIDTRHPSAWIKKLIYTQFVTEDSDQEHRLMRNLRILEPLNINKLAVVNAPIDLNFNIVNELALSEKYLVIHTASSNEIKQWPIQSWIELIQLLIANNYKVVLTAGPAQREKDIVESILKSLPISSNLINLAGKLTFPQLSQLLKNSLAFVGPDCGPAHLCASFNVPIFSIFGPTPASMWAPWPFANGIDKATFSKKNIITTINNVTIFQSTRQCVPCYGKHCPIKVGSESQCMHDISPTQVFTSINKRLDSIEVNSCE